MPGRHHPSGQAARRDRARARRAAGAREGLRLIGLLAFVHVAFAVIAVVTNVSFPIWIRLAEREGEGALVPALASVRAVDKWVTIPAYLLAAATGIALTAAEGIPFSAPWIAGSIALFVALMGAGFVLYRPVSRRRIAAAERGVGDPTYRIERRSADLLDLFIISAALVIFAAMVLRPS